MTFIGICYRRYASFLFHERRRKIIQAQERLSDSCPPSYRLFDCAWGFQPFLVQEEYPKQGKHGANTESAVHAPVP